MSVEVRVELGSRSYRIVAGEGLLSGIGGLCKSLGFSGICLAVSDSNVDPLYGPVVEDSLRMAGFGVARVAVPAGENSKSQQVLSDLYDRAVEHGLDRRSFVIALGGGVVGDLAGFLAATYLRGVPYVQAPTSLLAMVDSSVGGKTGINLPAGKNLVGAFHQPSLVLGDTSTLRTLPKREYVAGLAEVVKYGAIRDAEFFGRIEAGADKLGRAEPAMLETVIGRCCAIKAEVVSQDEREAGLRAILNFGHTAAHAIEQTVGYGNCLHGEAVAIGMVFAALLSVAATGLAPRDAARLVGLLAALGLPVRRPDCGWADIRKAMAVDKKTAGRVPRFVLLERVGGAVFGCEVAEDVLRSAWEQWV